MRCPSNDRAAPLAKRNLELPLRRCGVQTDEGPGVVKDGQLMYSFPPKPKVRLLSRSLFFSSQRKREREREGEKGTQSAHRGSGRRKEGGFLKGEQAGGGDECLQVYQVRHGGRRRRRQDLHAHFVHQQHFPHDLRDDKQFFMDHPGAVSIASVPQLSRESCSSAGEDLPSSCSMDSFFDKIFDDGHTCTHTHTCNPPGPNLSHTHTCFHVHTKILSAPPDETAESVEKSASPKKRPCNNREAVRKYREKKKAHAASLEDEAAHLRAINQQLLKRLQNQAALEAEIARLKCLLVDLRGRIEGEIGSFPYHKPVKGSGDFVSNF
ncbi:hypothetical protein GW17_00014488 [Ensete ventricosum]|nr:hypothetical protein GW17_00014488 [Ensete ventricosum]